MFITATISSVRRTVPPAERTFVICTVPPAERLSVLVSCQHPVPPAEKKSTMVMCTVPSAEIRYPCREDIYYCEVHSTSCKRTSNHEINSVPPA